MEVNVRALRRPRSPKARPWPAMKRSHACSPAARKPPREDGVRWVADLCRRLEIPPLRAYGVGATDLPDLVAKAAGASSMKGNPIVLTPDELHEIISRAL